MGWLLYTYVIAMTSRDPFDELSSWHQGILPENKQRHTLGSGREASREYRSPMSAGMATADNRHSLAPDVPERTTSKRFRLVHCHEISIGSVFDKLVYSGVLLWSWENCPSDDKVSRSWHHVRLKFVGLSYPPPFLFSLPHPFLISSLPPLSLTP